MTRVVVVTGTDTGVGKTIAVAALAAVAPGRVTVLKPVQTGVGGADPDVPDVETVRRLTGRPARQLTALDEPLAPDVAARRQDVPIPPVGDYVDHVRALAEDHDVVIVEGAGGLLVRLDQDGGTLLDLAAELAADPASGVDPGMESGLPAGASVEVVIVTRPGLGTLNHTELTAAALRARGLEPAGLVIGSWPDSPGLAEECNLQDLPRVTGVPVLAVLPQGAGALDRESFVALAPTWFR